MNRDGKYIYCVIYNMEGKDFGDMGIGIQRAEVTMIPHRELGAVVSNWSLGAFDSLPKETLFRCLVEHQSVIETVMKKKSCVAIPVKFGTVAADEEEVQEILETGYLHFRGALEKFDHKIELEVVALWGNLDPILKEVGEEEEIKKFKKEITANPSIESKIELGRRVKEALDRKRDSIAGALAGDLKGVAWDFWLHDLMEDTMIMNGAFLVDKNKEKEFEDKVGFLDKKYQGTINFRMIGPLPPYSFCSLEIKKMEIHKVEEAEKILGLGGGATLSKVKEAYRRLMQKFHPDKNLDNLSARKQFERINEAYNTLLECYQNDPIKGRKEGSLIMVKFSEAGRR